MALPSTSCGGGCHGGAAEERPGTSCGSAACDCGDRAVRKTSSRSLRPLRTYVVSPSSLPDRRHRPWRALRKWRLHPSADADRHTVNSLRVGLSAFVNTSANCGCFSPQRTRWVDPTQPLWRDNPDESAYCLIWICSRAVKSHSGQAVACSSFVKMSSQRD